MFRTVPLSIIRSFFTVNTAMVYVIQLASRIRTEVAFRRESARKQSANLYDGFSNTNLLHYIFT